MLMHSGRISVAEQRRTKAQAERAWQRELRARAKALLEELRAEIKSVRASRKGRGAAVRELCRGARAELRLAREEQRARAKLEREELRARGVELRADCKRRRGAVPVDVRAELAELARKIAELRDSERERRRPGIAWGASRERSTAAERRSEAEDEVAHNIPAELLPVWEVRRSKTRAGERSSLTEAFLLWVHNNSASVAEILYGDEAAHLRTIEKDERALTREYRKIQRAGGKPSPALRARLEAAGELDPMEAGAVASDDWGAP